MEKIFLRERVILKLIEIDQKLQLLGLRLLIQEGFRPLSVQKFVQEVSVIKVLRAENPGLSEDELREMAKLFAAATDGDSNISPPPHLTGGAVDLTLVYENGYEQVDMGKSGGLYKTSFPDALEYVKGFEEARHFRRLLYWLIREQDMTTSLTEWWHNSWGDQMWAWIAGTSSAVYGVAHI